jgi:hypothetical protein
MFCVCVYTYNLTKNSQKSKKNLMIEHMIGMEKKMKREGKVIPQVLMNLCEKGILYKLKPITIVGIIDKIINKENNTKERSRMESVERLVLADSLNL